MIRKTLVFTTNSPGQTHALGRDIGLRIPPDAVILLYGDLGSGKTAFVQGLARGIGVPEEYYVTSPTYTLINEYPGRCPLFHIDLYRLNTAEGFDDIGLDDVLSGDGVKAIEWAERLQADPFSDVLAVRLESTGELRREIRLTGHGAAMADWLNELGENLRKSECKESVVKERQWG